MFIGINFKTFRSRVVELVDLSLSLMKIDFGSHSIILIIRKYKRRTRKTRKEETVINIINVTEKYM